jgi:hypothetical protein
MSLDVYLIRRREGDAPAAQPSIYVREAGRTREISRDEWDRRFPGREPVVVSAEPDDERETVFDYNITHNLGRMADAAGIYSPLWRPDEIGVTMAGQLVEPLKDGLALLQSDPDRFRAFNPENGWGDYDGLLAFVAAYLAACIKYPDAEVRVSR